MAASSASLASSRALMARLFMHLARESNDTRVCIRCKKNPDNLDVAFPSNQHQRGCPLSIVMVDVGARCKESPTTNELNNVH